MKNMKKKNPIKIYCTIYCSCGTLFCWFWAPACPPNHLLNHWIKGPIIRVRGSRTNPIGPPPRIMKLTPPIPFPNLWLLPWGLLGSGSYLWAFGQGGGAAEDYHLHVLLFESVVFPYSVISLSLEIALWHLGQIFDAAG